MKGLEAGREGPEAGSKAEGLQALDFGLSRRSLTIEGKQLKFARIWKWSVVSVEGLGEQGRPAGRLYSG